MRNYHVVITKNADDDLGEIFEYLAAKMGVPGHAAHLVSKLYNAIDSLSYTPARCPLAKDEFFASQGFRILLVEKYIVIYVVDQEKKQVAVHRVLYGKRNYAALLYDEWKTSFLHEDSIEYGT